MANTDVRTLMLFEFNRALTYISEIIEIKRKSKKLEYSQESLTIELHDWNCEEGFTEEEKVVVNEIINETKEKLQDIKKERHELQEYGYALKNIVTKIIEAIMDYDDKVLPLEKSEIRQDMIEEYLYLLCDIEVENEKIDIKDIFGGVEDFIILLVEMYGEDATDLVRDIIENDLGIFDYYFK